MDSKLKDIRALEDKYGLALFRMGLTHLVDVGYRTFDVPYVEESIRQIMEEGEADKTDGGASVMSSEFQCEIIRCAAELTRFSIWTLFAYIKKYVDTGGL
jgi:hypothetical protein